MSSIISNNNNKTFDKFLNQNVYYIDIPLPFGLQNQKDKLYLYGH